MMFIDMFNYYDFDFFDFFFFVYWGYGWVILFY